MLALTFGFIPLPSFFHHPAKGCVENFDQVWFEPELLKASEKGPWSEFTQIHMQPFNHPTTTIKMRLSRIFVHFRVDSALPPDLA